MLGLAAIGGVVAAGVVSQRRRRAWRSYDSDELRSRLHERLAARRGLTGLPRVGADRYGRFLTDLVKIRERGSRVGHR